MAEHRNRWTPPPLPSLIASILVVAGVLLWMFAGKQWIFVAGLGAFGPGVLREMGFLEDHDEFQRRAAHRAGYHAYLVDGLITVAVISLLHLTGRTPRFPAELISVILLALWMSWLFSALLSYWGAARMTSTILLIFGAFWAVFVIADIMGESHSVKDVLLGSLVGTAIVAPFFILAYTAHRWPRATGGLLVLVGAVFLVALGRPRENLSISGTLFGDVLLAVPMLGTGIALWRESSAPTGE